MVLKINALHVYTLVHVCIFSGFIVFSLSNFQLPGERNYHVFYRLLSGMPADKLAKLRLTKDPWAYNYLTKVSPISAKCTNHYVLCIFKGHTSREWNINICK